MYHHLFGQIDLATAETWDASSTFAGRTISFDLNIESANVDPIVLARLLKRIEDMASLDAAARNAMKRDADTGDDAAIFQYVEHHLSVLSDADKTTILGSRDASRVGPHAFLSNLRLLRVGLYPEQKYRQLVLDYSIGREFTNYLLSVSFDDAGAIAGIDMES